MELSEVQDRTEAAKEVVNSELGPLDESLGIVPGTGWKGGMDACFKSTGSVPYSKLNLPGYSGESGHIKGHSKDIEIGTIGGRPVVRIGRVHANESKASDIALATRVAIGAIKDSLDGLIVTHGVGSLHGRVGREQGLVKSLIRTAIIDTVAWAIRGRRKDEVQAGDLAIVESIATRHFGTGTPLLAGEFVDSYHDGLHTDKGKWFEIARTTLEDVQGRAPRVCYGYVPGPQFEHLVDKLAFRTLGCDVIGMSGHEVSLAAQWNIPVAQLVLITNGAFGAHSHESNQSIGKEADTKAQEVLEGLARDWR